MTISKADILTQIDNTLEIIHIGDNYITKLWNLFGEGSEFAIAEIINFTIKNAFYFIVAVRGFDEFEEEFELFEEMIYETACPFDYKKPVCKNSNELFEFFTDADKIIAKLK